MIIHLDMDAFYASVEQRDNPALAGQPVIVGGHATRGVVLAASYQVRPFGVRSAMPMHQALRLAPKAVVVAPRFHAYVEASEQVFRIFECYTPLIEPLSLDEAFLDVTASHALFGPAPQLAAELRRRILQETGLPCSAGIAQAKFVAKIASDFAKPNGQHEVPLGTARAFLAPLPVSRLWGVGAKTDEVLRRASLRTIGDIASRDAQWLIARLGSLGQHLWELSHGIDTRVVVPDREAKSIGAQDTFDEDLLGVEALTPHVHSQALRVGRRLRKAGLKTRAVQLTVKYSDFTLVTRRHTLDQRTDDGQTLYREALKLLEHRIELGRKIRLTGVSANDLSAKSTQLGLFAEQTPKKHDQLNSALDQIVSKFGATAIVTADLVEKLDDALPRDGFYREEKRVPTPLRSLQVEPVLENMAYPDDE